MSSTINTSDTELSQAISDHVLTDLIGNWFLYATSMFVELTVTLVTLVFMVNLVKGLWTRRKTTRRTDPINLHHWKYLCLALTIFMRASMDAVMLLTWDEVTWSTFEWMITIDRVLTILAFIPFTIFSYIWYRAGPSIQFQLLRQPIPTDLMAGWKQMKKPLTVVGMTMLMCLLVTLAKV